MSLENVEVVRRLVDAFIGQHNRGRTTHIEVEMSIALVFTSLEVSANVRSKYGPRAAGSGMQRPACWGVYPRLALQRTAPLSQCRVLPSGLRTVPNAP
jgi:hypothetical protein